MSFSIGDTIKFKITSRFKDEVIFSCFGYIVFKHESNSYKYVYLFDYHKNILIKIPVLHINRYLDFGKNTLMSLNIENIGNKYKPSSFYGIVLVNRAKHLLTEKNCNLNNTKTQESIDAATMMFE